MLASAVRRKVEIPHEPGEWIEVRMLGWRVLELAREKRQEAAVRTLQSLDPRVIESVRAVASETPRETTVDLANVYDQTVLLHEGIVDWSYDAPVTAESIDDLDEPTRDLALREIVALLPQPAAEADRKNASGRSTERSKAKA